MYVPHHTPHSRFVQEGRPLRYPFWRGGKSDVPKVVIDVSLAFGLVEIKIYTVLCRKLSIAEFCRTFHVANILLIEPKAAKSLQSNLPYVG